MRATSNRTYALNLTLFAASLALAVSVVNGCGGSAINPADQAHFTALSASATTIRVNQQIQFTSPALQYGTPLSFYVNGVPGGNAELGTVDNNGLYTAPAIVPVPNTVIITSVASNYPSYPPGSVALGVLNPIPIIGTVTPAGFSEGTTTVEVAGSQFVYGAQIMWNGAAVPTTMVSGSELVAAIPAPNPGTFPLLVSNPNPGSANSATVSVLVGPGQVVLTLQPDEGTDVRVGNTLNFGLTVDRNQSHRRQAAGERGCRRQCAGGNRGFPGRRIHQLYCAAGCAHAQQCRAADHHQR